MTFEDPKLNLSAFFDAKFFCFMPWAGGLAHNDLIDDEKGDEPGPAESGKQAR